MAGSVYKLRPSAAAVWVKCHGMPALSAGMVEYEGDEDDTVREEGTACHWVAHQTALGTPPALGSMTPNGVEVDAEMQKAVAEYLGFIASWGVPAYFEQDVQCRRIHPTECGGQIDAVAYDPARRLLRIVDLKYGYRGIEPDAWQLICYLVGGLEMFGLSDLHCEVELSIFQPRAYHRNGPLRTLRAPASDFRGQINILQMAADAAMGTYKPPVCTVNEGCNNCAGRVRCQTVRQAALGLLDNQHAATPDDLPFDAAEDELRRLQWAISLAQARATGLEGQVVHAIKRGANSRHFALRAEPGRLQWVAGQEGQALAMAKLMGHNIEAPVKLITPTQAKEKLPVSLVDMYARRAPGSAKLVPADATLMRRIFGKM